MWGLAPVHCWVIMSNWPKSGGGTNNIGVPPLRILGGGTRPPRPPGVYAYAFIMLTFDILIRNMNCGLSDMRRYYNVHISSYPPRWCHNTASSIRFSWSEHCPNLSHWLVLTLRYSIMWCRSVSWHVVFQFQNINTCMSLSVNDIQSSVTFTDTNPLIDQLTSQRCRCHLL